MVTGERRKGRAACAALFWVIAAGVSALPACSGSPTDGVDLENHDDAAGGSDEAATGNADGTVNPPPDAGMPAADGNADGPVDATLDEGDAHDAGNAGDAHGDMDTGVDTGTPIDAADAGDGEATRDAGGEAEAAADAGDLDASVDAWRPDASDEASTEAGLDAEAEAEASADAASDSPADACAFATCVVGTRLCNGNDVQGCIAGSDGCGLWRDLATCTDQTCVSGACDGVCAPGQSRCTGGNAIQGCDPIGHWGDPAVCTGATPVCKDGACLPCGDSGAPDCPDANN